MLDVHVCVCKCVTAVYLEAAESSSGGNRVKISPSHWLSRRETHPISCSRSPAVTNTLALAHTLPYAFYLITSSKGNPNPSCQTKPLDYCIWCYCHLNACTHFSTTALSENERLHAPTSSHTHALVCDSCSQYTRIVIPLRLLESILLYTTPVSNIHLQLRLILARKIAYIVLQM